MEEDQIMELEEQEDIENDKQIASDEYGKEFLEGFDEGEETKSSDDDGFDDEDDAKNEKEEVKEEADKEPEEDKEEPEGEKDEDKPPEPLKIVFLGKEHEVPPEEIKDWVQRGFNEKRLEEKLKQYDEDSKILDEFQDLAFFYKLDPKELVKRAVDSYKQFEIQRLTEDGTPEDKAKKLFEMEYNNAAKSRANQPKPKEKERDYISEIDKLFQIRPHLVGTKKLPDEVNAAVQKGLDVATAYLDHENKEKEKEINQLKADLDKFKEAERKKEQAEKAKNAPKSQKGTGGGAKKSDPFLQGFGEDY